MSSSAAVGTVGHTRPPFVADRGRWRVWWVLRFVRGLLLSLLGGDGHYMGGCRPSWTAEIVCGGGTCVTFHGTTWWRGGCGLALGGGSTLWATVVGMWWLLVEECMSQVCDFGIINVQLACEINNMM